jgi:branched-chain amino acid transport system permease protein
LRRRLAVRLIVLIAAGMLAGCSPVLETDQARLCRMALPALMPQGARIVILAQAPDADGRGLNVVFTAETRGKEPQRHLAACRFRMAGRPRESHDLTSLTLDGQSLSEAQHFFLVRYWLATPEGRAADPAPLGDLSALPVVPHAVAYGLQMALGGLPLASIYALLAAAYSLIYALIGRINFAFGEIAAAGGYAAAIAALAMLGWPPAPLLTAAFVLAAAVASAWGFASARVVFIPLRQARGQQVLVATVGLAIFLRELLRLAQGDRSSWMSPQLNQPFALARAGDFVAVATMMGISPAAVTARAFALSGALAGLAGATMTAAFGAVGYSLSATLTLKALTAAIIGGIGSLPGAFLGGLIVGAVETGWSALFPIDYRDIAVYALLAIFIALRPSGLLGQREAVTHNLFPRRS